MTSNLVNLLNASINEIGYNVGIIIQMYRVRIPFSLLKFHDS